MSVLKVTTVGNSVGVILLDGEDPLTIREKALLDARVAVYAKDQHMG